MNGATRSEAVVSHVPPPRGHAVEIPTHYASLDADEVRSRTQVARAALGDRVLILGHHYQVDEVLEFADHQGDSYALSVTASRVREASHIVFAGVHFMAESADILTDGTRCVILPDAAAGCPMADMAAAAEVVTALAELAEHRPDIRPLAYMNTSAAVKAVAARHGGAVCTSSNARHILTHYRAAGAPVLFLPDEHLGRNVAVALGVPDDEIVLWRRNEHLGGNTPETIARASVFLWDGHCSVHTAFSPGHIDLWRERHPDIRIVVHPECPHPVVKKADAWGSTAEIIRIVESSAPDTKWAIGTEIHLVERLRRRFPDRFITSLSPYQCLCTTMYRIRPTSLLWSLEAILNDEPVNQVRVPAAVAADARLALDAMIRITEQARARP